MRATWVLAAVLAAAAIVAVAASGLYAQDDNPAVIKDEAWNESIPAALGAARFTGRPVLIFFAEDWCGFCEQVEKVLLAKDVRDATRRFILVKTNLDVSATFAAKYGIDMHHQIAMFDWSGKLISKVTEFKSEKDVALAVIEAAVANDLQAARKLEELGYYSKAVERYRVVAKITHDDKSKEAAKKAVEEVSARAARQMALIRQLIRTGRNEEAMSACSAFLRDFPPDMGAAEAKKLLGLLKSGKPVKLPDAGAVADAPKEKLTADAEAKRLLEEGMVFEWDKSVADALASYEKASKLYPATPSGIEAARRAKMLLDDPATRALADRQKMDKECKQSLEMGKLYEENDRADLAAERYRSILDAYPGSDYAREAQKRIEEMQRHKK